MIFPPKIRYSEFLFEINRYVSQSESGNGLINNVEYADPRWIATVETQPLYEDDFYDMDAAFQTLKGGIRSTVIRHPGYKCPRKHKDNKAPSAKVGTISAIENMNRLSITGADTNLILSTGDFLNLQDKSFYALARITKIGSIGAARIVEVEPKLPRYIGVGASVYFDRAELLMRPIWDSYKIGTYPFRKISFQMVESRL